VYDALCTTRPYRDAWTPEDAAAYLEDRAGEEFDPSLVGAFIRLLRRSDVEVRVMGGGSQGSPPE
jgi:putative two-component system response regulator